MKSLAEQMSFYQRYHTKEITKLTHYAGVPCVIFSLLIALNWIHISMIPIFNTTLAWIVVIAISIYYLILDFSIGLATTLMLLLLTYIAELCSFGRVNILSLFIFGIFFVGGWIMQFIGHHFEGNRPAFFNNLFQVLIAPIFLVAELFFTLGYKKKLQQTVLELAKQA